ncbi:hypothetical protein CICLE_v10005866mg [Citrus x clementina]|uniref:Methyltransferase type 11 domain-containing protein n=1 Tax=Citrus clementina TaxID=85681 RepID=V4RK67_CITCL|nr:hypothetical protein CICLE_v10005866mg [Citrus x clementina]
MAELFIKQAKQYAETRPNYPEELFKFITSKTTNHDLAWDVGTGSGQAAASLSGIFENVIGTETSPKQIEFATKLPNIRYELTSPAMSIAELEQNVAAQSTVDLVTIAQAMHWFDLPQFYNQVKWYMTIDFPFEPVDGADSTGPFDRFVIEKTMDQEGYFTYIRSWSAYQTAKDKGVELLTENVIENFRRAWNEDGQSRKVVRFPIYLRIGKVGNNI